MAETVARWRVKGGGIGEPEHWELTGRWRSHEKARKAAAWWAETDVKELIWIESEAGRIELIRWIEGVGTPDGYDDDESPDPS
jgi:hypothetical protein